MNDDDDDDDDDNKVEERHGKPRLKNYIPNNLKITWAAAATAFTWCVPEPWSY